MRKKKATQELSKIGKVIYSLLIAGVAFLVVNGISGIGLFYIVSIVCFCVAVLLFAFNLIKNIFG